MDTYNPPCPYNSHYISPGENKSQSALERSVNPSDSWSEGKNTCIRTQERVKEHALLIHQAIKKTRAWRRGENIRLPLLYSIRQDGATDSAPRSYSQPNRLGNFGERQKIGCCVPQLQLKKCSPLLKNKKSKKSTLLPKTKQKVLSGIVGFGVPIGM